MIPKEVKYNLHYGDGWGDVLPPGKTDLSLQVVFVLIVPRLSLCYCSCVSGPIFGVFVVNFCSLSCLGAAGRLCFVIVAFSWYLYSYLCIAVI